MPAEPVLPFIAILRGIGPDEVLAHAEVLAKHRFAAIEVPTNSPDWALSVTRLVEAHRAGPEIGAGTVLFAEDLERLHATGARLMVTPNTDVAVIGLAKAKGLRVVAGVMTPSEALAALAAGADALKIFPASVVGPGFASSLAAVLPRLVPLYAVGGITTANLADYANRSWSGFGLGSELYRPGQSVADTEARAAAFRCAWQELEP